MMYSFFSFAITVDKMVIIPGKDEKKTEIKVSNPEEYPVFLRVTLSELQNDSSVDVLKEDDFENWPVYLEREEYIAGPEEQVVISVELLARQIGKNQQKDRVIAIDIMPESILDDGRQGQTMNILLGYRVWLILSKDGQVAGRPSIVLEDDSYILRNDSDSVAIFNIDLCQSEFEKEFECKGSEFVLSGKKKILDLSRFKNGQASISIRDPYFRYQIESSIKL
ncbi:TPA: hypothetical protein I7152_11120 [Vibrio vulnificus]|nr:hypothetical protein [Vibrio vulnificus]